MLCFVMCYRCNCGVLTQGKAPDARNGCTDEGADDCIATLQSEYRCKTIIITVVTLL